ncbi:nickel pincer cofactor biosynthesis protein LarC [Megalodesulfovibrio paquesii]
MTMLYYDCAAGISGDMHLAALLGLGVPLEHLQAELSRLGLDDEFSLHVARDARNGIVGLRVDVQLTAESHAPSHDHEHGHNHAHSHAHPHGHEHAHGHEHGSPHSHPHAPHRNFADIRHLIEASTLDPAVQATSLAIFRRLAEAEATVHGKPVDEVHFHEVGATDSIVDIVGAAICVHFLKPDAIWASPVELGGGVVRCAHGLIPVPAPATVELLAGIPTTRGATPHETTTPTGAAILATLVDHFTATPRLIMDRTAYGIGHRQTELPNVLRVHLARPVEQEQAAPAMPAGAAIQQARLLQCNLDDMTAEMLGVAMELLMEEGAMDVHFTPIVMKKNRPATCLSLLCAVEDESRFKALLFRHTTTLGVKSFPLEKTVLDIRFETLNTPLGPVTLKHALQDGRIIRSKPELEDCKTLARWHDLPLTEVYALIAKHRG